MIEQRANHTATLLDDGRVLLIGGQSANTELATTEVFDPASGAFTAGPTMLEARANHTAVKIGGSTVAVIGGRARGGVIARVEFVQLGGAGQVYQGPALATPRSHAAAALIPNQDAIVVAGGFGAVVTDPWLGTGLHSIEVISLRPTNLAQSTMVCGGTLPNLQQGRGAPGFTVLPSGALLLAGGVDGPYDPEAPEEGSQIVGSAELLTYGNITSECRVSRVTTSGAMSFVRGAPVLTPLLGGDILITGGFAWEDPDAHDELAAVGPGEIFVRPR
jgi:hypothetical protein